MANRSWSRQSSIGRQKFKRVKGWGVEVDPATNVGLKALVENAYPRTARVVETQLERLRDNARSNWPVKTGASRDSIRIVAKIRGDLYRLSLQVPIWYAGLIKSKGTVPANALILDQAPKVADEMSEAIAKEIAR